MAQMRREVYAQGDAPPAERLLTTDQIDVLDDVVNRDATDAQLAAAADRLRAIRVRSQEIRAGYTAMTNAQKNRAVEDLADGLNDACRSLLNVIRFARSDHAAPPEV